MKQLVTTAVMCALLVMAFAVGAMAEDSIPRMEAKELLSMIDSPDVVIIDVRQNGDWNRAGDMIKNARRESPNNVESWIESISKDKTIVLYCA